MCDNQYQYWFLLNFLLKLINLSLILLYYLLKDY